MAIDFQPCAKESCQSAGVYPCPPCRCSVMGCFDRRADGDRCEHHEEKRKRDAIHRGYEGRLGALRRLEEGIVQRAAQKVLPEARALREIDAAREVFRLAQVATDEPVGEASHARAATRIYLNPRRPDDIDCLVSYGDPWGEMRPAFSDGLSEIDAAASQLEAALEHPAAQVLLNHGVVEKIKKALIYAEVVDE